MKYLILVVGLILTSTCFSQEEKIKASTEDIYTFVDEDASFHGGTKALFKFLNENLTYYDVEGKLYVKILVEKDGTISDVVILKGITDCPECSRNAVKVIKMMPHWIPAKVRGKNVRSYFEFPIMFKKN